MGSSEVNNLKFKFRNVTERSRGNPCDVIRSVCMKLKAVTLGIYE